MSDLFPSHVIVNLDPSLALGVELDKASGVVVLRLDDIDNVAQDRGLVKLGAGLEVSRNLFLDDLTETTVARTVVTSLASSANDVIVGGLIRVVERDIAASRVESLWDWQLILG